MKEAFVNEIVVKPTDWGNMHDLIMSNGDRVGAGKFPPKGVSEGDYVAYDTVTKRTPKGEFLNLKPGSLSKKEAPAGISAPSAKPGFVPSADKRQETIAKQSALNSALQFVSLLVAADALPMPKTTKIGEKADLLNRVVDRYTAQFYRQSTGTDMDFPDNAAGPAEGNLEQAESGDNWEE